MYTQDEILTKFTAPITTYTYGKVVQGVLLGIPASDPVVSAKRVMTIMAGTEIRSLLLNAYEDVTLTDEEKEECNTIPELFLELKSRELLIKRALTELSKDIPLVTINLLENYLSDSSPAYYTSVCAFIVMVMVIKENE